MLLENSRLVLTLAYGDSRDTVSILLDSLFLHLLAVFLSGHWPLALLLLIDFFHAMGAGSLVMP